MGKIKKVLQILKNEGIKSLIVKIKNYYSNEEKKEYYNWIKFNSPSLKEIKRQKQESFKIKPKISIVIPLYNTPKKYLIELIKSVQKQTYLNWELCLADGSTKPLTYLEKIVKKDSRIKYKILETNKGISGNTNEALKLVTGDYIALLDHDDLLPINSLYEIVKTINQNENVEFIYTDEDKFTNIKKKTRYEPNFKPDYLFDTLTSYNYICHFSVFKKELMEKLGGFKEEFNGSQDYDLILRAVENAKQVIHIPKILYHWRVHPNSTAGNAESKPYCYEAGKNAVQAHLDRKNIEKARTEFGVAIVRNRVIYDIKKEEKVLMFIYIQDDRINLEKLKSDINNITYKNLKIILLVDEKIKKQKDYEQIVLNSKILEVKDTTKKDLMKKMNQIIKDLDYSKIIISKDIQDIKTSDFVEQLLGFVQREDVGVISPRIIHKYTSSQYNGTIYGIDTNEIGYIDYIDVAGSYGYLTRGAVIQDYSIIKSECIMISKQNLEKVNYLDQTMDYEDAMANLSFDLFKNHGKLNVLNPHIELEILEKTEKEGENNFFKKWEKSLNTFDPSYNVNLKFEQGELFKIKQEKVGI